MKQLLLSFVVLLGLPGSAAWSLSAYADEPLSRLEAVVPRKTIDCTASQSSALSRAADAVELWAAGLAEEGAAGDPKRVAQTVGTLVAAKQRVDAALDEMLSFRTQFVRLPDGGDRRQLLRGYLNAVSKLIDLSGRLRYLMNDAIANAADALDPFPEQFSALIDLFIKHEVSIGAAAVSFVLFDPPPGWDIEPFPPALKLKVLRLIEVTRQVDLLPDLAEFLRQENAPPELLITAAEVVRQVGLPQDLRPGADPKLPPPAITRDELQGILSRVVLPPSNAALAGRRGRLLAWLETRKQGIVGETCRLGGLELRSGDWLLMRNPSPYNLFTDLSPGLFTHVGVVGVEQGDDGVRRFVIVDLPERGEVVPATNVDIYLQRTLHYCFLRHDDPLVGRKMGEAASSIVGNETQFDLTFRTDRVLELKDKPLAGALINTYCAGLLLLCAQESGAPREEFFPIPERPAGGKVLSNLGRMGISIGERFVSPTGALFSPQLRIVGRREPMYSPGREITEWIYDQFAHGMRDRELKPSLTAYQLARQKLAELSNETPWLARALARAHNVGQHVDLASAARAAAVVETLDAIAEANVNDFTYARSAMLTGPIEQLAAQGYSAAQIEQIKRFRRRHEDLFERWTQGRMSPRELGIELVEYYKRAGARQVEERFFGQAP